MKPPFVFENTIRLDQLFQIYGDKPALMTPDATNSFGDVERILRNVIAGLKRRGVEKGHRVALHGPNSELHLYLFLASWLMDFLYVPLDFKTPLGSLLSDNPVDFLMTGSPTPADFQLIRISPESLFDGRNELHEHEPWPAISLEQEASAIFTSGSTGKPRGIVHTVGNYVYSAMGTSEFIGLEASDRWLLSLPLFHVGGVLIWVRTLLSGCTCILPGSLQNLADAVKQYTPTVISLVPAQLIRLIDRKDMIPLLQGMKTIMLGGAPSPAWLIDRSLDLELPIMPTYGSTEACAQITGVARGSARQAYTTSGKVLPYRCLRIADGDIVMLGGKTLFKRYLNQPASVNQEDFFMTADSGMLDPQGNLIIFGRTDGIFISGGENISPAEIEKVLLRQEGVVTAIVVPVPHHEFGLTPWAFVETSAPFDEKRMFDRLRQELPGYKLPKRIIRLAQEDRQDKMKFSRKSLAALAMRLSGHTPRLHLHYEETGPSDAPVIVFLHGFMGSAGSCKAIMASLAGDFRCIAFDLPGHGASLFSGRERLKQLSGMTDTARLILEDLDSLGIQRFTLYGYSMGGRMAQHIALAAPDRIACLILESASFGIADLKDRTERLQKDRTLLAGIKTPEQFRTFLENWYNMPLFRTLDGTPQRQSLIEDKIHHPVGEFQEAMNRLSVGGHDVLAGKLAACHIPVHYFCGAQDATYRQTAEQFQSQLPELTIKIFPNASHNISIQFPHEIARSIREILI